MNKLLANRKIRLIIAFISLILLIDMVQDTYAKYISSADATGDLTIARWAFLVNNQDVLDNNDFSTTITPIFDPNTNIASGVIAPTSTGYFDIVIDYSDVGVSFDEVITLSLSEDNTISDLKFTGYKKNNDPIVSFTNNTEITATHILTEQTRTERYRVYIEWFDGAGEELNNAQDTDASIDGIASVDVNIQFIQKAN